MAAMKTTDVVVRHATSADRPSVERLLDLTGLPLAGLDDVWAAWVADRGGGVVGTAALERHQPVPWQADRQERESAYLLRGVAVDPALRGMGIGAALVDTALDNADRDAGGQATVAALTESAVGYFEGFGFTRVERSGLPACLAASAELSGACPESAAAYLRRGAGAGPCGSSA